MTRSQSQAIFNDARPLKVEQLVRVKGDLNRPL